MKKCAMLILSVVLVVLTYPGDCVGAPAKFGPKWNALIGEWSGEGEGGGGACGFHFDLSEHVIVRTNHAILTGSGGRPGGVHDDLIVIAPGASDDKASANYFDNEGHVIEYAAEWAADGKTLTLASNPGAGPQFRLIYKKLDAKSFSVAFEMKMPGQDGFKPYTSGTIRKTGG